MHSRKIKPTTGKKARENSNSNTTSSKNKLNTRKREDNDINSNIKVDYNNNYFYKEDGYYNNGNRYYESLQKRTKYNKETNDSYVTVEQEDGQIKYMPKKYFEYKDELPNPNYYDENSNDDDVDDDDERFGTGEDYEEAYDEYMVDSSPQLHEYREKSNINNNYIYSIRSNDNSKQHRRNNIIIDKAVTHEVNFSKNPKKTNRNGSYNNGIKNSADTNQTYNNNKIYNVQLTAKSKKSKKKNSIYQSTNLTIAKNKNSKQKDYFKMNNIDKSNREKYIRAAVKIQSNFRAFLTRKKIFNCINLYISSKSAIITLQQLFNKRKKNLWKLFKKYYSIKAKSDLNIIKNSIDKKPNINDKKITNLHKELGDSFNIIIDQNKKESNEMKLKSQLNDVMKENDKLKSQILGHQDIEEKMKNLVEENKKNQNINAIIVKDNQQLAKKLKDIQDYRNTNLIIDYQPRIDLTQKDEIVIEDLINENQTNNKKLKKFLLKKIIFRNIDYKKDILKQKFNRYKNLVENEVKTENENKKFIPILFSKISALFQVRKIKFYNELIYKLMLACKDKEINTMKEYDIIKNIINIKNQKIKSNLIKAFYKLYFYNCQNSQIIKEENDNDKNITKQKLLKVIFERCNKDRILMYKTYLEKWNLKSKIIGIRAAARDKKKKRKLKRKNNKLNYKKDLGLMEQNYNSNKTTSKFCKSIHELCYVVSGGTVSKESTKNENNVNVKNSKMSTSSDKINKMNNLDKKFMGLKKTNSVNEIIIQNKPEKIGSKEKKNNKNDVNENEESDEDSGDYFDIDNNSEKES